MGECSIDSLCQPGNMAKGFYKLCGNGVICKDNKCHDHLPLQPRHLYLLRLRDCAAGEGEIVDRNIRLLPKAIRLTDERREELSQSESRKSPSGHQGYVR